jgi:eukaryotic-like serine/threonine-protein kinase
MIWQPGRQLQKGEYTIQEILSVGHLNVTYLARTPDGQTVVIKAPNDEAMQQADFDRLQQVFVQEAFKLAKCQHPHIVQAEAPFQEDGIWCIPMEYIAGFTLEKRDRPILPEAEALRYIWQIGDALGVVHQAELLHRNINPANILIRTRNGEAEAVLIDFGLARKFDQDFTQTRSEEITPGYTPLELYSSQADRGAYTDLYSLGATLYNLLTGNQPPAADERKLEGLPVYFPDSISSTTRQAIESAMQLKATDRPASVALWLQSLNLSSDLRSFNPPSPDPASPDLQPSEPPSNAPPNPPAQPASGQNSDSDSAQIAHPNRDRAFDWEQKIQLLKAIAAVLGGLAGLAALMATLHQIFTPSESPQSYLSTFSSPYPQKIHRQH